MTNNTGERVGKTESWCEPEFDKIGGESCVRAQDSEVGHDSEPKPPPTAAPCTAAMTGVLLLNNERPRHKAGCDPLRSSKWDRFVARWMRN